MRKVLARTSSWLPWRTRQRRRVPSREAILQAEADGITALFRNPAQLSLIVTELAAGQQERLDVAVFAAADGSEAVSLFLAIKSAMPAIDLNIWATDLVEAHLECARSFRFERAMFPPAFPPEQYPDFLEHVGAGEWELRREWRACFKYQMHDLLETLPPDTSPVDLVVCQNVLVALTQQNATKALRRVLPLVKPLGYIAVGGGPLDLVPHFLADRGFEPVCRNMREVHDGWKVQRSFYSNRTRPFWALEPFDPNRPDSCVRYCSLFRRTGLECEPGRPS